MTSVLRQGFFYNFKRKNGSQRYLILRKGLPVAVRYADFSSLQII
jgi:hypothetical protein